VGTKKFTEQFFGFD